LLYFFKLKKDENNNNIAINVTPYEKISKEEIMTYLTSHGLSRMDKNPCKCVYKTKVNLNENNSIEFKKLSTL